MSDKIVTHEDLAAIEALENRAPREWNRREIVAVESLLARVRAAAEADAPPLPEGWTVRTYATGNQRVFWCDPVGNMRNDSGTDSDICYTPADVAKRPGKFTPLRPTITEADLTAAVATLVTTSSRRTDRDITRDMFKAAGVEVSQP